MATGRWGSGRWGFSHWGRLIEELAEHHPSVPQPNFPDEILLLFKDYLETKLRM